MEAKGKTEAVVLHLFNGSNCKRVSGDGVPDRCARCTTKARRRGGSVVAHLTANQ
jgi:hypothetical protein